MQNELKASFAFLVVTYNHQDYILEHLESIKFLVQTYGAGIEVDLIISDDCSRDQTQFLVDQWLERNIGLFRHVNTLYNSKNIGTCKSVNNMLSHMLADRCKLTAGDDVYSFENIFELTQHGSDVAMVSGRALYLLGDDLKLDRVSNILLTTTQLIYQNNTLLHRFKHFSYNNAPNLFYASECLMHTKVRLYLQQFDVVEDWPLQVAMAREFPQHRLELLDKVLVYYRRTAGSTYIVANQRFVKDKIQMYDELIKNETNIIERLRLSSRRFCFKSQNRWVNKFTNLDMYFFLTSFALKFFSIIKQESAVNLFVNQHQQHYAYIRSEALAVRKNLNEECCLEGA
ncbi:MAG: hypothetical protein RL571_3027 [Pseudomonadota bacterium]|jgi:glycosyltransferase involved in cell wall biosynthesis